jgi:hypothetical protein
MVEEIPIISLVLHGARTAQSPKKRGEDKTVDRCRSQGRLISGHGDAQGVFGHEGQANRYGGSQEQERQRGSHHADHGQLDNTPDGVTRPEMSIFHDEGCDEDVVEFGLQ